MSGFNDELDELRDPPIPDGSDPTIDDDGIISHEETDEFGNIIRDNPNYIAEEDRETPFTAEEDALLEESKKQRTMQGLLALGVLFWLGA